MLLDCWIGRFDVVVWGVDGVFVCGSCVWVGWFWVWDLVVYCVLLGKVGFVFVDWGVWFCDGWWFGGWCFGGWWFMYEVVVVFGVVGWYCEWVVLGWVFVVCVWDVVFVEGLKLLM